MTLKAKVRKILWANILNGHDGRSTAALQPPRGAAAAAREHHYRTGCRE
jgi:hypothetical protein